MSITSAIHLEACVLTLVLNGKPVPPGMEVPDGDPVDALEKRVERLCLLTGSSKKRIRKIILNCVRRGVNFLEAER